MADVYSMNKERMTQSSEMLKDMPTKDGMSTEGFKSNTRKRHLPKDDTYSLEAKLTQEAAKIIKIKVENEAVNCELKQKIKNLEAVEEIQKKNLYQQLSQYAKLEASYQNEQKLRENVLNKINSTRGIQKALEIHSGTLRQVINTCQEDRQKLSESYQQAIEMLQKMKCEHLKIVEQNQTEIENLQTKLASEKQLRLDMTNNWDKRNKNAEEYIEYMKKQIFSQENTIEGLKIEKIQMTKSIVDMETEITNGVQIINQKEEINVSLLNNNRQLNEELNKEISILKEINEQREQRMIHLEEEIKVKNQKLTDENNISVSALMKNMEIEGKLEKLQARYKSMEDENKNYKEEMEKNNTLFEIDRDNRCLELAKNKALVDTITEKNSSLEKELNDRKDEFNMSELNSKNKVLELEAQLKSLKESIVDKNVLKETFQMELNGLKTQYEDLKFEHKNKIEHLTKENINARQEHEKMSITLTAVMSELKSAMEIKTINEKSLKEYENNVKLLRQETEEKSNTLTEVTSELKLAVETKTAIEKSLKEYENNIKLLRQETEEKSNTLAEIRSELKSAVETKTTNEESLKEYENNIKLLQQEIEEKSITISKIMSKLMSLMETNTMNEKSLKEHETKAQELQRENDFVQKYAADKCEELKNVERTTKNIKNVQVKSNVKEIFNEDNWSCQSDSSCDDNQVIHSKNAKRFTSPLRNSKSMNPYVNLISKTPDVVKINAKGTPGAKFSKPKTTTTKLFFKR